MDVEELIYSNDSSLQAAVVLDDSVHVHVIDLRVGDFYLPNALDWDSVLPLAEYLMVYPVEAEYFEIRFGLVIVLSRNSLLNSMDLLMANLSFRILHPVDPK